MEEGKMSSLEYKCRASGCTFAFKSRSGRINHEKKIHGSTFPTEEVVGEVQRCLAVNPCYCGGKCPLIDFAWKHFLEHDFKPDVSGEWTKKRVTVAEEFLSHIFASPDVAKIIATIMQAKQGMLEGVLKYLKDRKTVDGDFKEPPVLPEENSGEALGWKNDMQVSGEVFEKSVADLADLKNSLFLKKKLHKPKKRKHPEEEEEEMGASPSPSTIAPQVTLAPIQNQLPSPPEIPSHEQVHQESTFAQPSSTTPLQLQHTHLPPLVPLSTQAEQQNPSTQESTQESTDNTDDPASPNPSKRRKK